MDRTHIFSLDWKIGTHMQFNGNLYNTIEESLNFGIYSLQFFMGNPKSYKRTRIFEDDISNSLQLVERFPLSIFTHFPYISNLCGSVSSLAWNGDNNTDDKLKMVLEEIEYELSIMSHFSEYKSGVVIHPGSFKNRKIGLETISKTINYINFKDKSRLLLENSAGEGNKLCSTFKEISTVIENIDVEKRNNIGVCVDTAHIFGSGEYNLTIKDEVDRLFHDFQRYIGMSYFSLLHLNDSVVEFNSKKDRHACIGDGYIWKKDKTSLFYLLTKCMENNIPIVLETVPFDIYKF